MLASLYVYIVQCADDSFYTGVTNDLERRLEEHNRGTLTTSYTYPRRPVVLRWSLLVQGPNQAISLEKQLKGWTRAKKLALIEGQFDLLPELSLNKRERDKKC